MKKFFPALVLVAALSGCNSDCPLKSESVQFKSNPEGAQVVIDGELKGTTPCVVTLSTESTYNVVMKKQGFKDEAFVVSTSNKAPLVKFGPLDEMGYYKQLTPNPVSAELEPLSGKKAQQKK